jgi:ABC-2 type transport system permease protein
MVFRQSIQRRRALALAGLTSLPGLLLALAATTAPSQSIPDIYHGLTVALLLAVGLPVTGLLTAGAAFSEERRAGTIPYLVVKPLPRSLIAIAVTIGAIAATLAIAGVGVAFGWLVAAVVTGQAGIGVPAVAALGVGSIGYAAAFVPLGLLLERVTLTGLVYLFLWEGVLTGVLTAIS